MLGLAWSSDLPRAARLCEVWPEPCCSIGSYAYGSQTGTRGSALGVVVRDHRRFVRINTLRTDSDCAGCDCLFVQFK